jgi:glycosyltransferase involved in cell wall biosynthesis
MNILYIARNIPVPGIVDNDIILRICKQLKDTSSYNIDIWFPKEILFDFLFFKGRLKAIAKLPNIFSSQGHIIKSIRYIRLPKLKYSYLLLKSFLLLNRKRINEANNIDLIVAHYLMPDGYMGLELKKKFKIPLIVIMRNGDLKKMNTLPKNSYLFKMFQKVLRGADSIIIHNYLTEKYLKNKKLNYLRFPHGIERKYITEYNEKSSNIIICVSNFIARKNINWVISAFKKINSPDWQLIIIGEGILEAQLKDSAKGCDNIIFLGKISRKETLEELKNADIFVLPSNDETFGLVYLEAAASGCAIIGKRYTGIYSWLEEEKEALFAIDSVEFKEKLIRLMRDKELRLSISKAGYDKVVTDMIWEDLIEKYKMLYQETLNI